MIRTMVIDALITVSRMSVDSSLDYPSIRMKTKELCCNFANVNNKFLDDIAHSMPSDIVWYVWPKSGPRHGCIHIELTDTEICHYVNYHDVFLKA